MESTALEMLPEAAGGAGLQLRRDLRRIRCALLLCLLAVLLLLLPTAYLLLGHLRAPASCAGQVRHRAHLSAASRPAPPCWVCVPS